MQGVNDIFKEIIISSPMVVFARQGCPYCIQVIETLRKNKILHNVIYINTLKTEYKELFKKNLLKRTGRVSVPAVFIREKYIGGCNDSSSLGIGGIIPLINSKEIYKLYKK